MTTYDGQIDGKRQSAKGCQEGIEEYLTNLNIESGDEKKVERKSDREEEVGE